MNGKLTLLAGKSVIFEFSTKNGPSKPNIVETQNRGDDPDNNAKFEKLETFLHGAFQL